MDLNDIDIEQLISFEGFEYKLSSGNSGLQVNIKECPHCGADDWKVYANADTGLGNCFKCSWTFNKFKFVKAARGFSNNSEVFKYLTNHVNTLTYRPKVVGTRYTRLNKEWKLPLNMPIEKEEDIPQYLKDRGIDSKIAKRFDLRMCDSGFYIYENHNGKNAAIDFSNRVLIPIRDISGELATFQGRDITGKAEKKYLFPNMLPASGAYIYNADYAKINNFKKIILCEGVFDVFAATHAIESDVTFQDYCVCGTFGKHLGIDRYNGATTDQLADLFHLRENGLEEIVILWDGEPKATLAAMQTALNLNNFGFNNVRVGLLPDGCDPNETTKEEVLKSIRQAEQVSKLSLVKYRMQNAR